MQECIVFLKTFLHDICKMAGKNVAQEVTPEPHLYSRYCLVEESGLLVGDA